MSTGRFAVVGLVFLALLMIFRSSDASHPIASLSANAAPPPSPTPTSTTADSSLNGVLSEGDSISYTWGGNHTGMFASAHPNVPFFGRAVGGSGLLSMIDRFDADVVLKPKVVTIFIGANDVYDIGAAGSRNTSTKVYLKDLFSYAKRWRATGAKVLIATVLAQCIDKNPNNVNQLQNKKRVPVNEGIRAGRGVHFDDVIDFAADPVMGTDAAACDKALFHDGLHPSDGGEGGQGKLAAIYTQAVERALK